MLSDHVLSAAEVDRIDPGSLGRVAVLMGGMSPEREVSLSSGSGVLEALRSRGVDAEGFDPAEQPVEALRGRFDRAFIALHGRYGEDGTIQGVLEYLRIPYTGPGVCASAVAMDKDLTRRLWREAGLPVARGRCAKSADEAAAILVELGADLVVKPVADGSSIGVSKLSGADEAVLGKAVEEVLARGEGALVEERIFGRELTIAIVSGRALPVIEIRAPEGDYDYHNKYFGNAVAYDCPARLTEAQDAAVRAAAEKAFAAIGARGWARADLMLRPDGSFVLLEINTSPGMTPHSLVPMAARAVGVDYAGLCLYLAAHAALDYPEPRADKARAAQA